MAARVNVVTDWIILLFVPMPNARICYAWCDRPWIFILLANI